LYEITFVKEKPNMDVPKPIAVKKEKKRVMNSRRLVGKRKVNHCPPSVNSTLDICGSLYRTTAARQHYLLAEALEAMPDLPLKQILHKPIVISNSFSCYQMANSD